MTEYESVRRNWWASLKWHLKINGTRPSGTPGEHGDKWKDDEFAWACGVGDTTSPAYAARTVQYWVDKRKRIVPPGYDAIEKALFGDNPNYAGWRIDLRSAYEKAKESKKDRRERPEQTRRKNNNRRANDQSREPRDQLILDDPRAEGQHLRNSAPYAASVIAKVQRDEFEEREEDIAFLDRFVGEAMKGKSPTEQFRWALITGPAGQGKTRLAIHFLNRAEARGFRGGFVRPEELNSTNWQPNQPTLAIVDYVAESPHSTAKILRHLASTASRLALRVPVRVLLLEREASGVWTQIIVPQDSSGAGLRSFCFQDSNCSDGLGRPLTPLSTDALLRIMRGRLDRKLSDDVLLETLVRVDPQRRPLFAAATAQAIASALGTISSSADLLELQMENVLGNLIERERSHFWSERSTSHTYAERRRLAVHENLLLLATFTLDLPRTALHEARLTAARGCLPATDEVDEDRYRRMAGGNPIKSFSRLEPDVFGEFFVLNRLTSLPDHERQCLIDVAWTLGGNRAAEFWQRCATDFGDLLRDLNFLRPSIQGPAASAFVAATTNWMHFMRRGRHGDSHFGEPATIIRSNLLNSERQREGDIADALSLAQEIADQQPDLSLRRIVATARSDLALRLSGLGRWEEAITSYDALIYHYGQEEDPKLQETIAEALFSKGELLEKIDRKEDAIAVFDRVFREHSHSDNVKLRDRAADAIFYKAYLFITLNRDEDAIATYDDIIRLYAANPRWTTWNRLCQALVFKARRLDAIGLLDEAIMCCQEALDRESDDKRANFHMKFFKSKREFYRFSRSSPPSD